MPPSENILDVGCGPKSWLWNVGLNPVGLDLSTKNIDSFIKKSGSKGIVASADELPIENDSFDSVWCFGLFHHLPDDIAQASFKEMERVCQNGGHIIIFDAVLPISSFRRPLALLIRRADRGRYMRKEEELLDIVRDKGKIINKKRVTYSYNGLEATIIIIQKD